MGLAGESHWDDARVGAGVAAVTWLVFGLLDLSRGHFHSFTLDVLALAGVSVALAWGMRDPASVRNARFASHLTVLSCLLAIAGHGLFTGQRFAIAPWFLALLPLYSAYYLGRNAAMGWAAACVAVIVALDASMSFFWLTPEWDPPGDQVVGKLVVVFAATTIGLAFRSFSDSVVVRLRASERELKARLLDSEEQSQALQVARDEALGAARTKNALLANLSHEVRTPLHGIMGMSAALRDTVQTKEQREILRVIDKSTDALMATLTELLEYAKIDAAARQLEALPFDVRACAEDQLDLVSREAFDKGLDLGLVVDLGESDWGSGDIVATRQILGNIIGNAVKFTDRGSVMVYVSRVGDAVTFEVRDTGIGLEQPLEQLMQPFAQGDGSLGRRFGGSGLGLSITRGLVELAGGAIAAEGVPGEGTTLKVTVPIPTIVAPRNTGRWTSAAAGASGLFLGPAGPTFDTVAGLAPSVGLRLRRASTAAELDDALAGGTPAFVFAFDLVLLRTFEERVPEQKRPHVIGLKRVLDSSEFPGARAVLYCPVRKSAFDRTMESVIEGWTLDSGRSFTSFEPDMGRRLPARILVVEDNQVNRQVAEMVFSKLGYEVDLVPSGAECLALLERVSYDIIFMDLSMPGMDGFETTREIRRGEYELQPYVVALTASVAQTSRDEAFNSGMDGFLGKPFDVMSLMNVIENWARARRTSPNITRDRRLSAPPESPYDQLRELLASNPARLAELVDGHVENARKLLDGIQAAVDRGDLEGVRIAARSLKSSAAQFGSDRVASLAASLERLASTGGGPQMMTSAQNLRRLWAEAEARLASEAARLRSLR